MSAEEAEEDENCIILMMLSELETPRPRLQRLLARQQPPSFPCTVLSFFAYELHRNYYEYYMFHFFFPFLFHVTHRIN